MVANNSMSGGANTDHTQSGEGWGSIGGPGDTSMGLSMSGAQPNTAYSMDRRTGLISQIGMPSLNGGMMHTPSGWKDSGYDSAHYANTQRNIKTAAAARQAAQKGLLDQIKERGGPNYNEYAADLDRAWTGKVGDLDAKGYDTQGMRDTHTAGGLLGAMFGLSGGNDVETESETKARLGDVDPNNPMGYAPLGFAGLTMSPLIGAQLGEITNSPVVGALAKKGIDRAASAVGPDLSRGQNVARGLLGMAGLPGNQITQMAGLMGRAADLNYAGYTGSSEAPGQQETNDTAWWMT